MIPELALRATIWLSVIGWAAAEVLRRGGDERLRAGRVIYTAGALLLAVHSAAAFELRHGWSHAAAFADTAARSAAVTGVAAGAGLYLNYLMIALWCGDAAWWWLRPAGYRSRARAADTGIFLFFLFMFVNGAVVFVSGPMRVLGAAAVAAAIVARVAPAARRPVQEIA